MSTRVNIGVIVGVNGCKHGCEYVFQNWCQGVSMWLSTRFNTGVNMGVNGCQKGCQHVLIRV